MVDRRKHKHFRILFMNLQTLWGRLVSGAGRPPARLSAPRAVSDGILRGPESLRNLGRNLGRR